MHKLNKADGIKEGVVAFRSEAGLVTWQKVDLA